MSPRPLAGRAAGARRGRTLLVWLLLVVVAGLMLGRAGRRRALARGFAVIEAERAAIEWPAEAYEPWIDRAWETEVRLRMADFGRFEAEDSERPIALAAGLLELSFVAEVGGPQVLWPDGLSIPVRFHRPVACVVQGDGFLPLAEDGTILSGRWSAPPRRGSGFLPVLTSRHATLEAAAAGDVLSDPGDLRGLRVAASLWKHLDAVALEQLGCAVLDPWGAPFPGTEEPSVLLMLEGERLILFGRAPGAGAGELAEADKWEHVMLGLDRLARDDWDLLDVRWDRPELRLRAADAGAGGDPEAAGADGDD